jgi:hypothetical protein
VKTLICKILISHQQLSFPADFPIFHLGKLSMKKKFSRKLISKRIKIEAIKIKVVFCCFFIFDGDKSHNLH